MCCDKLCVGRQSSYLVKRKSRSERKRLSGMFVHILTLISETKLCCQLDCAGFFPLGGTAISLYSSLGSSNVVFDVDIKAKISRTSYNIQILCSIYPSSSLMPILQRQEGIRDRHSLLIL